MLFPQNIYSPFNPATGMCNFFFLWCNYNDKGVSCGYKGFNIFRSLILLILYNLHLCNHFWAISRLTSLKGNKILGEKKTKLEDMSMRLWQHMAFSVRTMWDLATFLRSLLVHEEKLTLMFFLEATGRGWVLQGWLPSKPLPGCLKYIQAAYTLVTT